MCHHQHGQWGEGEEGQVAVVLIKSLKGNIQLYLILLYLSLGPTDKANYLPYDQIPI